MKYLEEAARHVVLDQIETHVNDSCPYAGDSQRQEWNETIMSTMANDSLDSLRDILQEWQSDSKR
jgi:ribosome modulation factor